MRMEDIGYNGELGKYIYNELNLYLKRHQINYNLIRANEKIEKLGDIIRRAKEEGKVVKQLEELHYMFLKEFWYDVNKLE